MRSRRTGFAASRIIGTLVEGCRIMCMTGEVNSRVKRDSIDGGLAKEGEYGKRRQNKNIEEIGSSHV
jgi:hypothetical protein